MLEFDGLNFLVIPKKSAPPFPCAILMHGYSSDKIQNSYAFPTLVERGYAIIAIDAEYHGDRKEKGKDLLSLDFDSNVKAFIQTIIDLRRTIDYLEYRNEIDKEKIVYLGSSMGAIMGAIFCAVEKRVKICTLFQGGGDWKLMLKDSQIGPLAELRKAILDGKVIDSHSKQKLTISDVAEKFKLIDPIHFIGEISPRPLFIANSKDDKVVPNSSAKILHEMAKEPKITKWVNPIPIDPTRHSIAMWELITESINFWDKYLFPQKDKENDAER